MNDPRTVDDTGAPRQAPVARPMFSADQAGLPTPHPMLLADSSCRTAREDVGVFFCVVLIALFALQGAAMIVERSGAVADPRMLSVVVTLFAALILLATTAAILKRRRQPAASIGLCVDRWWRTFLFGIVAVVGAYAVMIFTVGVIWVVSPAAYQALSHNPERITAMFPKLHPAALLALTLTVGFYEEVICRGFLLTRLRRATGSVVLAVVVSSAVFAVPHAASQAAITVVPLFLIGVLWAVLTVWQRSVVPVIIGHGVFDLCQLIALYQLNPAWE